MEVCIKRFQGSHAACRLQSPHLHERAPYACLWCLTCTHPSSSSSIIWVTYESTKYKRGQEYSRLSFSTKYQEVWTSTKNSLILLLFILHSDGVCNSRLYCYILVVRVFLVYLPTYFQFCSLFWSLSVCILCVSIVPYLVMLWRFV